VQLKWIPFRLGIVESNGPETTAYGLLADLINALRWRVGRTVASRREFVHIALGTNLGNRSLNLEQAIGFLGTIMEIQARSSVYETPPWGVEDQPRFYNQVVNGYTALPLYGCWMR
jgi:hypothetical protein